VGRSAEGRRRGSSRRALPVVSDCQLAPSVGTGAALTDATCASTANADVKGKSPYSSLAGTGQAEQRGNLPREGGPG
jgi:hypothetical protein